MHKEALVAWGTANLLFIRRWAQILPGPHDYFLTTPRGASTYLLLMAVVLFVTLTGWTLLILARRSRKHHLLATVHLLFLGAAALGLHGLLQEAWVFFGSPRFVQWVLFVPLVLAVCGVGWLQWRHKGWHRKVLPVTVSLMLILSPLAPILFAHGTLLAFQDPHASPRWNELPLARTDGPHKGSAPTDPAQDSGGGRVVWIVLDELDQRLVYDERPMDLELPEFDRLREESFSAPNAQAASDRTLLSVPAMTTGHPLLFVEADGPDRLLIQFADTGETESWSETDTVFSQAHEDGRRIGIVGTYHPYCRVFREHLEECTFFGYEGGHEGIAHELRSHIDETAAKIPFSPLRSAIHSVTGLGGSIVQLHQQSAIMNQKTLVPRALESATDERLDLVYIHLLVPHPAGYPGNGHGYWDPEAQTYSTEDDLSYLDNLVLADRTLMEIRTAMQESGVWNETTVIVSSDHGHRYSIWERPSGTAAQTQALHEPTDHRVPLLIRPASPEPRPHEHNETINLILLRGLVEQALSTGFHDTKEIADWFQENGPGPEPEYRHR